MYYGKTRTRQSAGFSQAPHMKFLEGQRSIEGQLDRGRPLAQFVEFVLERNNVGVINAEC